MRLRSIQIGNKFIIEYTSFAKRQIFTFCNQKKIKKKGSSRLYLLLSSSKNDLDSEIEWFKEVLES